MVPIRVLWKNVDLFDKGDALCRQLLLGHCCCRKLSFERHGASNWVPWGTILAPWGHPGGPWEQQEEHVDIWNQIFNLEMIVGLHFDSVLRSDGLDTVLFVALVSR